ncbi:unnamed protein product, partial [Staurois parvus]
KHFQSGHFPPLPASSIFSFQRYHTLNDNCAVMQHCTHMYFFSIFLRQIKLYFGGIYFFLLYK